MKSTLIELAHYVGGVLHGDDAPISGVREIQHAVQGDLAFISNAKYQKYLTSTHASGVLVSQVDPNAAVSQIVVPNPYFAFARALGHFFPAVHPQALAPSWVHPEAVVDQSVTLHGAFVDAGATIGAGSYLYPGVYVGMGASVGVNCVLYPNVCLAHGCSVGNRVIVHAGAVIGSDGFGYATNAGVHHKIPQVGVVVVEDDVEIGANTTIDRAALGTTRIGNGSKIDNLVQVGHNVTLGQGCILAAHVGLSGSVTLGNYVVMGGQSATAGHLTITDRVIIAGRGGATRNIDKPGTYAGFPLKPHKEWQKEVVELRNLSELRRRIAALEAQINSLVKDDE
ncbi:UDP-3-O-(3-hydroxymyristoyl)glucosamine N-acyltransferase [Chrysiogenes arsenatis]|uniref:UDP-3-O-(3-hydroxymyristoyl)glucosamine N-acyltransferase n=1 Tax=Chrysiogenes arsenatis TaxID=309797 RepID=UPI00040B95C1|nr:UDP-3-O-(3-hydroxymyristoyl)glucosamine N-acyltransferase [Chrysiogenes arsenatis]